MVEKTTEVEPTEEPPAPEQANKDMEMTDAARPYRAPEASSAAPAAHVLGATDTSGTYSLHFNTEGCASSCVIADGFCFIQNAPGKGAM